MAKPTEDEVRGFVVAAEFWGTVVVEHVAKMYSAALRGDGANADAEATLARRAAVYAGTSARLALGSEEQE